VSPREIITEATVPAPVGQVTNWLALLVVPAGTWWVLHAHLPLRWLAVLLVPLAVALWGRTPRAFVLWAVRPVVLVFIPRMWEQLRPGERVGVAGWALVVDGAVGLRVWAQGPVSVARAVAPAVVLAGWAGAGMVAWSAGRGGGEPVRSWAVQAGVLLVPVGAVGAAAALMRPALGGVVAGGLEAAILWRLILRVRVHERNALVKAPAVLSEAEEVAQQWEEARDRAGLRHHIDPERVAGLLDKPATNGVGGWVLRVDLRDAQLLPEDLPEAAVTIRRVMRFDHVHTRRVDTNVADLHLYRGVPLAEPVPWSWLAAHPADPESVTIGPTLTAQAATISRRLSMGWFGFTNCGKTSAQLAVVHSLTAVQRVPVHLLVLDNREQGGRGGSELDVLRGLPGVTYRNRTLDAWELVQRALDIMGERQASKGRIGNLVADDETPHVRLIVTEMLPVLRSRPPVGVKDWPDYTRGLLNAKPNVAEWRALLAEQIAEIVRSGRDVEVTLDFGAQAGQIEEIPGVLRRILPQRGLGRVGNQSDIAPVLGDASGVAAHKIPKWQSGAQYLLDEDGNPLFARAAYIPPADLEAAVVTPLREWGRRLLYVVDGSTHITQTGGS
jgi:hypothetical protein